MDLRPEEVGGKENLPPTKHSLDIHVYTCHKIYASSISSSYTSLKLQFIQLCKKHENRLKVSIYEKFFGNAAAVSGIS